MTLAASLQGKKIVLGITGGIAAYKSAELARLLIKSGAEVQVVMTEAAKAFITPLTMQALTGHPVRDSLLDPAAELGMGHIELARWADLLLVAPATADFIARLHAGMGNDLLSTLCLATSAPIALAPAMNEKMWLNPLTQRNLTALPQLLPALSILGPASGEQACGDVGYGRMLEPSELHQLVLQQLAGDKPLAGKRVVITAGPTREAIDPVRFLSNHSSGKMGFALAQAAQQAGAEVTLLAGPVSLATPIGVKRINVESAQQLFDAALNNLAGCDVFIGTAAVADYRVANVANQKIKKDNQHNPPALELIENPDIIANVAKHPQRPPLVIAFAAETNDVVDYARRKLVKKAVDAVVANDVSRTDIGFGSDQNEITFVSASREQHFGPAGKDAVAAFIMAQISALENAHDS